MKKEFDLSVYFILDPSLCGGVRIEDVCLNVARGGVRLFQLRNKISTQQEIIEQAMSLKSVLAGYDAKLLINDHVGIAKEVNADGVHIGQGDISAKEAREILGPEKIIGLTAFTGDHIDAVDPNIIDYIGTGPVFETKTDKGKTVLGVNRFAELVQHSPVPVAGIGGITAQNAGDVIKSGADGVAMMRAISLARDPEKAAAEFVHIVKQARQERAA